MTQADREVLAPLADLPAEEQKKNPREEILYKGYEKPDWTAGGD